MIILMIITLLLRLLPLFLLTWRSVLPFDGFLSFICFLVAHIFIGVGIEVAHVPRMILVSQVMMPSARIVLVNPIGSLALTLVAAVALMLVRSILLFISFVVAVAIATFSLAATFANLLPFPSFHVGGDMFHIVLSVIMMHVIILAPFCRESFEIDSLDFIFIRWIIKSEKFKP